MYQPPSLESLKKQIIADIEAATGVPVGGEQSVTHIMATSFAGALYEQYQFLANLFNQSFVLNAQNDVLERHGADYNITRKTASKATCKVSITATQSTSLPSGSSFKAQNGDSYTTITTTNLSANTALAIDCIAEQAGLKTALKIGEVLTLSTPVIGITNASVTVFVNGTNKETDADYKTRILNFMRNAPLSGAQHDYHRWALEVAGVKEAWVAPNEQGDGTVVVRFVTYNANPFPTDDEVAKVKATLDSKKPVTASVFVVAPIAKATNLTIKLNPNNASVQTNITNALKYLFDRKAVPGQGIYLSNILSAIGNANGVVDFTLITPAANLTTTKGEILTLGTITWQS